LRHDLARLRDGLTRRDIRKYLPEQPWFEPAAVVLFFTAVFSRSLWKYDYPRAYRAILAEVGHVCQTFLLTATWLGLAPFCTMAVSDADIEKDLGLDGLSEAVLYAAGCGARPAGTGWAPSPPRDGSQARPYASGRTSGRRRR
jgi:SagB-type dehydrogenase family enzyme